MPVTISIPVVSWMIALLAFIVLVFFVFAMVVYLRRCIATISQKYQDTADLSTTVAMLEADKAQLEKYLAEQKQELEKVKGEREEQESVRQDILAQQGKLKDLESTIESLTVMKVERQELETRMEDRRKELESIESAIDDARRMKDELPSVRAEYERLKKVLEQKMEIDFAVTAGKEQLKQNEEQLKVQAAALSEQQASLDELTGKIRPLEEKRQELEARCADMNDQLRKALEQKMEIDFAVTTVRDQVKQNEEQLKAQSKTLEERQSELEKIEEKLRPLKDRRLSLEDQCTELNGQLQKSLERKLELDFAVSAGKDQVKQNEEQLKEQSKALEEKQSELEKIEEKLHPLEDKHQELENECTNINNQLQKYIERKVVIEYELNASKEQLKQNEDTIKNQENTIENNKTAIKKIGDELRPLEEKRQSLEDECTKLHTDINDLVTKITGYQTQHSAMCLEISKLESQIQESNEKYRSNKDRLDSLTQKKLDMETLCSELEQTRDSVKAELSAIQPQLDRARSDLGELKEKLEQRQKELQDVEAGCETTGRQLKALEEQKLDMEDLCWDAKQRRDAAEQELAQLQSQLAAAKTEFASLNAQLPGLKSEVQTLWNQLANGPDGEKDRALDELMRRPLSLVSRTFVQDVDERDMLQAFKRALHNAHLKFPDRTVNAFHTSLKCQDINPLTVLAGVSGTGKTLLPVKYAEFMGINQIILSVQPRWDSAQDLFGFYNYLEHRYKATELSRCLLRMDPYGNRFVEPEDVKIRKGLLMVLLDEMNLARPEYYFSEFLSKLELRRTTDPDNTESRSRASIELDTGTGNGSFSIWVPNNILFVGTMNEDESTQTLSDKVLDRANVLRFGKPAQRKDQNKPVMTAMNGDAPISASVWQSWKKNDFKEYADACGTWTRKLNDALAGIGRAFGFRVEEAIYSYVANYPEVRPNNQAMLHAFADQVEQKILPKLRGCDMTVNASSLSLDTIEDVIKELDDEALLNDFRLARENAGETGIFLWQGVTRS